MMTSRRLITATTVAFLAMPMLGAAQASTVTYNLALTDTIGPESGTGTLTVNGPIASTGLEIFTSGGGGLNSLNFTIDGSQFTLGAGPGASATFLNGNLISLNYAGALSGGKLTLGTAGLGFLYRDAIIGSHTSVGTISDSLASATPLPPTWTLILIGLAGLGVMLHRRKGRDNVLDAVPA